MADRNRNQWDNPSNQDWDQNSGRYGRENVYDQNRGNYGNVNYGRESTYDQRQGGYTSGSGRDYESDYNRRNYGNTGSNYGYSGTENYGNRGWQEGDYGNTYGSNMNMGTRYDRNAMYSQKRGYGSYGNASDDWGSRREYDRGYGNWQGNYGVASGSSDYDRGHGRSSDWRNREQNDRNWWDKTTDEVSSWFGDEDAERRRRMDRQLSGQHRGKGPKGYHRSDERIREDINDRLSDDDYLDASDIEIQVNNREVVLTGIVDSREAKRRAEDIIERISGVTNVENRLRVGHERAVVGSSTMSATDTSTSNESRTP